MAEELKIRVNEQVSTVVTDRDTPLLCVLANELRLQGPRFGYGLAQAGSARCSSTKLKSVLASVNRRDRRLVSAPGGAETRLVNAAGNGGLAERKGNLRAKAVCGQGLSRMQAKLSKCATSKDDHVLAECSTETRRTHDTLAD
jgi:hypothetical protein